MNGDLGSTIAYIIGMLLVFIILILIVACITAFPVKWLWNWLMPILFNLQEINFWQALGLEILCSLLFKTIAPSYKSNFK